jgi:hypothetical protein
MENRLIFFTTLLISTTATSAIDGMNSLTINTTSAKTGDIIQVSWKHLFSMDQLNSINTHKTIWTLPDNAATAPVGTHFESECKVVGSGDGSFWVGQFSPPVSSLTDVRMTGDPARGGGNLVTEGTPPFTTPAPVKFISGTQLSRGFYNFKVTNMREDVNWVLFEGSLDNASNFKPIALSASLSFTDQNQPQHGRLARTSSVDEIRVSWTQRSCGNGCRVEWGLSSDNLNRINTIVDSNTYSSNDLCGRPANSSGFHSPGIFYSVILDLSEETVESRMNGLMYHYRYGSEEYGFSSIKSFLAPKPPSPHVSMNILVTADMGETYEDGSQYHWEEPSAVNTTLQMGLIGYKSDRGVDVIMHPGDLAYSTGYGSEWDRFMEQIEPLSSTAVSKYFF